MLRLCRWSPRSLPPCQYAFVRRNVSVAPVILRPYQEHCLEACLNALSSGSTRLGVSLPTGSGKTTVFISLLSRLPPPESKPQATKSLIIVNSIELARQSATQVARLFPHWVVEIEQGSSYKASGQADVTVATYQTLNIDRRIEKFDPRTLKAIIVDEAHHAAAPSYRRLLSRFDSDIRHPGAPLDNPVSATHKIPIIGFSATFSRHDGLALGSIFQRIVYHRDFLEMIKEQWLCDVRFTSVRADMSLKDVTINARSGDFNPRSLAQVINTNAINDLVVRAWIDRASERRSTLVFCCNIAHVHELTQTFRKFGIDARYLFSKTPMAERKALVESFRKGSFPVLVNCAILTEGADIPNIDCVVVARPTRSRNVFSQMIGRGMRLSPETGKPDCRIIDFVDSNSRVEGVICTPTLFGLNPNEVMINDETPASLEERAEELEASQGAGLIPRTQPEVDVTSITYEDQDDPFSFAREVSKPGHIHALSQLSWVACGGDVYVLELLKTGFIRIEAEGFGHGFAARYTAAAPNKKLAKENKWSPFLPPRDILTAEDLGGAIRGCETYVKERIFRGANPSFRYSLLRSAPWRLREASEAQKTMLAKRWLKHKSHLTAEEKMEKISHLTQGDAANIITRLRHGAQGRYRKKVKDAVKSRQAVVKEQNRRAREVVRVGLMPV